MWGQFAVQMRRGFLKSGIVAGAVATPLFTSAYERFRSDAERVWRPGKVKEKQMEFDLNGFRMHYEIFGDGGEPLLWLHGWSGSGEDWKFIFNDVPAGFHVLGPDMRGNGASSGFEGTYTFRQSARDIFALLDHLGIQRIKAIGLSGGGITLLHMATQQPERIVALVAVSAPPYFPTQARKLQKGFSFESLPKQEQEMMRQRSKGGDEQIAWLIEQTHKMADSYEDANFTPPLLQTITAKTLIVFGDSDPLYPVKLAFELQDSIPHSSLWVIPKGGHGPIFGANATRFAETAVAFLTTEGHSR
jgi:pimeloyl-ACP methyl ester carboxylesterase